MNDILNAAKTALQATSIGKHVYEGWPETFIAYPVCSVTERVRFGTNDVHELTVQAWTKGDSQTVKDLLRTLSLTGYATSVVSIADSLAIDVEGIWVYPVTAVYTVVGTGSGTGTAIVYPSLRPIEQEVENAIHEHVVGLAVWRAETEGMTLTSPCVIYSVVEDHQAWWTDYTVTIDYWIDGEPLDIILDSITAGIEGLVHARQLSYVVQRDKETGYHIAHMTFEVKRAIGE
jgi:hypothetical protein